MYWSSWVSVGRLRGTLTPTRILVLNGGAPGHVFGPVAGILRAVVVNGLVREWLRLIPHEQEREDLLILTGLIEAGKLTPVLDRTYRWPARPRACAAWSRDTHAGRGAARRRPDGKPVQCRSRYQGRQDYSLNSPPGIVSCVTGSGVLPRPEVGSL